MRASACASWLLLLLALGGRAAMGAEPAVTRPPKLLRFVEAAYPPDEKAAGVSASVLLSIEIDAEGRVAGVTVLQSGGADFDQAAVAAARQFVFEPAEVDGEPAPVKISYRYRFAMRTERVVRGPQVNLEGVVLDRFSKKPVAGVTVEVTDVPASSITDDKGYFQFVDLPVGRHSLKLSAPSLVTVATEEETVEGRKRSVKYLVEQKEQGVDEERVVRAPRIKKESVEVTISSEEARRVPGTEGDTLEVVQNLPGVARSTLGSGQLIVWGSAPNDTRIEVDGVQVPALYHLGGLRSTLPSDFVSGIELVPGAFNVDYGRGLGGLVLVETRPLPAEGVHGFLSADVIDSSAMLTAAVGDKLRIGLAGRYSYLDRVLQGVVAPDVGGFFPIPSYDDYQLKATLALRKDEELTLTVLGSDDRLRRAVPSLDPAEVESDTTDQSFQRVFLRYTRLLSDGSSVVVIPSLGFDQSLAATSFGTVPTRQEVGSTDLGLRAFYRSKVADPATLTVGLDTLGTTSRASRSGSITLPPREGDIYVFGQPPGDVNADAWRTAITNVAPFAYAELVFGRLTVTPGVRLDTLAIQVSRLTPRVGATPAIGYDQLAFNVDPRVSVAYSVTPRLTLNAAAGVYHQPPEPSDLSAVFGTPTLGPSSAVHAAAGLALKLTGTLSLEATGFYKLLDSLILRNPLPNPQLAEALVQDGQGRSYGVQVLLRQELFHNVFGWISYSLSRSERKYDFQTSYRLFDYDQTHVLAVVASWQHRGWGAGVRLRYASGMPRTPVVGAFYDSRDDLYQPLFGAQNSIRIPAFLQADVRLDRTFYFGRTTLNLFLDVENVTNRQNPEEIVYNYNYTSRGYITGLPILAVLGVRFQF